MSQGRRVLGEYDGQRAAKDNRDQHEQKGDEDFEESKDRLRFGS
jgi:hypothetical protein